MYQQLNFEKVVGHHEQIQALYILLGKREHNISHKSLPSFEEHKEFVTHHPYRVWYLIKINQEYIGSTYLLKNNSVGISVNKNDESILLSIVDFISRHHKPLKEIKSVRAPYFHINVSPSNRELLNNLDRIGAVKIQITYSLESFVGH